jgi:hypothetical protein
MLYVNVQLINLFVTKSHATAHKIPTYLLLIYFVIFAQIINEFYLINLTACTIFIS